MEAVDVHTHSFVSATLCRGFGAYDFSGLRLLATECCNEGVSHNNRLTGPHPSAPKLLHLRTYSRAGKTLAKRAARVWDVTIGKGRWHAGGDHPPDLLALLLGCQLLLLLVEACLVGVRERHWHKAVRLGPSQGKGAAVKRLHGTLLVQLQYYVCKFGCLCCYVLCVMLRYVA